MFKSCLSILSISLSLNLASFATGYADEAEISKESIASAVHINQENMNNMVKNILNKSGRDWKLLTKVERKNGSTTTDYVPAEGEGDSFKTFVGPANQALFVKSDQALLSLLQKLYPGDKITDYRLIQRNDSSLLAEWSTENISDPDQKTHSWIQGMNSDQGLVILLYTTCHMDKIDEARTLWQPLLEKASLNS